MKVAPPAERSSERKRIERDHYDRAAEAEATEARESLLHGPEAIERHLRQPYVEFSDTVRSATPHGGTVVDIGAGTGVHSLLSGDIASAVIATDISVNSLVVAKARSERVGRPMYGVAADAEQLPLRSAWADVVTSAGVLYCLDLEKAVGEIVRVLKPDGAWIFVDSYDHSVVYRANRFFGVRAGRRTARAFTHIPNERSLNFIRSAFAEVSVSYFGVWSFLWPVLHRVFGRARAAAFLEHLEPPTVLRRYAFKIVVVARNPRPRLSSTG